MSVSVDQAVQFALRNTRRVIVPARNSAFYLSFRQVQFVFPKRRLGHHVVKKRQHRIRVFFQARKTRGAGRFTDTAFNGSGHVFERLIKLVARHSCRAAASHHGAGNLGQPALLLRVEQISGPHQGSSAHERQFVIFQQVHLQPVPKRENFGFRYLHGSEGRIFQVFIGRQRASFADDHRVFRLRLCGGRLLRASVNTASAQQHECGSDQAERTAHHFFTPFDPPVDVSPFGGGSGIVSRATVRVWGTKYFLATRITSSALILSYSSNCVNSLRQSP